MGAEMSVSEYRAILEGSAFLDKVWRVFMCQLCRSLIDGVKGIFHP